MLRVIFNFAKAVETITCDEKISFIQFPRVVFYSLAIEKLRFCRIKLMIILHIIAFRLPVCTVVSVR